MPGHRHLRLAAGHSDLFHHLGLGIGIRHRPVHPGWDTGTQSGVRPSRRTTSLTHYNPGSSFTGIWRLADHSSVSISTTGLAAGPAPFTAPGLGVSGRTPASGRAFRHRHHRRRTIATASSAHLPGPSPGCLGHRSHWAPGLAWPFSVQATVHRIHHHPPHIVPQSPGGRSGHGAPGIRAHFWRITSFWVPGNTSDHGAGVPDPAVPGSALSHQYQSPRLIAPANHLSHITMLINSVPRTVTAS